MLPSWRPAGRLLPVFAMCFMLGEVCVAQILESEPNEPCSEAQTLGIQELPLIISGELSLGVETPDIDFLIFSGPPDTLVQIDLLGADSGGGTLGDPFLGVLDAGCTVLALDDDGGDFMSSRAFVTVPWDGQLVIAASSCCDWALTGDGWYRGSYTIVVDAVHAVSSIAVRVVDADTGLPLVGWWPSNASAELWRCHDFVCDELVGFQSTDDDGRAVFTANADGTPLQIGAYEVRAVAQAYEPGSSGVFEAGENEQVDLGDLLLEPSDLIASISGRVVDALDQTGLPGTAPPWTGVSLARCDDLGCWNSVGWVTADESGSFRFDQTNTWAPLLTGDYHITAWAEQYQPREVAVDTVIKDEERDIGELPLQPNPVQFVEVTPCFEIPPSGGECLFSVVVRSGFATRLDAEAWSIVSVYGTGSFLNSTSFQAGVGNAGVSVPERFRLAPGQTKALQFRFDVPESVQQGAWICPRVFVGKRPDAQYSTLGSVEPFCVFKQWDSFELLPEKEVRRRIGKKR